MQYKKWSKFIFLVLICWLPTQINAQSKINPDSIRSKMQWFADAKLGIFIHWGIYAVNGIGESWSFHNGQISWKDYMKQMKGFTASK
jgi:alpha-L-fucosidase